MLNPNRIAPPLPRSRVCGLVCGTDGREPGNGGNWQSESERSKRARARGSERSIQHCDEREQSLIVDFKFECSFHHFLPSPLSPLPPPPLSHAMQGRRRLSFAMRANATLPRRRSSNGDFSCKSTYWPGNYQKNSIILAVFSSNFVDPHALLYSLVPPNLQAVSVPPCF